MICKLIQESLWHKFFKQMSHHENKKLIADYAKTAGATVTCLYRVLPLEQLQDHETAANSSSDAVESNSQQTK